GDVARVEAGDVRVDGLPSAQPGLALILATDVDRIVRPADDAAAHGSTIGWPGSRFGGALPPSQALTVAPTSANSPSWMRPAAFLPGTYARSRACSRA